MPAENRTSPEELLAVARRVVWFEPAAKAVLDRPRFLRHVMQYGTVDDVLVARRYCSDQEFRNALDHADAGSLDRKSWSYWNLMLNDDRERPYPAHVGIS